MSGERRTSPVAVAAAAALAVGFATGPTPGDVGACGRTAEELDRSRWAESRKSAECERCLDCDIRTDRCAQACDPAKPPSVLLPATCRPLVHDGEVCLRVLAAASCDAFATYVDEAAPVTPSECDFCRVAPPAPITGAFGDAGAGEGGR